MNLHSYLGIALLMATTLHANNAQAQNSSLGAYGQLSTWCGHDPIPRDVTEMPSIGCFILSAGHSATATIVGHQIEAGVDEKGQDVFKADGTIVTELIDPQKRPPRLTNVPYVHTMGVAGYSFSRDATNPSSPSSITIFSRNPDKTILFFVSKCLPPDYHVCVNSQENWDYEISKRK